jgi:hypothetical protein
MPDQIVDLPQKPIIAFMEALTIYGLVLALHFYLQIQIAP